MRPSRTDNFLKRKIKSQKDLKQVVSGLKARGKKIVFTNGCFDLIHYGHIKYLMDAKSKGDILIVAINTDASVKKIKGRKRPIINEKDRIKTLAALESVDYAVLFGDDNPLKVIKSIKPDILVKGADWDKHKIIGGDFVASYGGRVSTIKFATGRSTTNLIKKIAQTF